MWQQLLKDLKAGNVRALARSISLVENEHAGYEDLLQTISYQQAANIIGRGGATFASAAAHPSIAATALALSSAPGEFGTES